MTEKRHRGDWILASTTEQDQPPERLSEVAFMTNDDFVTLDEEVGENLGIKFTKQPFGEHFDPVLRKIVIRNLDDVLALFHEIGHGVSDRTDPLVKKIIKQVERKIHLGQISNEKLEEITELLKIRAERMASAYALKKIRQMRDKYDVDLLEDWDTDSVLNRVHTGIESVYKSVINTKEYKQKLKELIEELESNGGKRKK